MNGRALGENDRAAVQLLDDFLVVHNRLERQRKADRQLKQPRRNAPPVHAWRANDNEETSRRRF